MKHVSVGEFGEGVIAYSSRYCAGIVEKRRREIEIKYALWSDEERAELLQLTFDDLAADHTRCVREITGFAARGMCGSASHCIDQLTRPPARYRTFPVPPRPVLLRMLAGRDACASNL